MVCEGAGQLGSLHGVAEYLCHRLGRKHGSGGAAIRQARTAASALLSGCMLFGDRAQEVIGCQASCLDALLHMCPGC
jgi:hypothetical protein